MARAVLLAGAVLWISVALLAVAVAVGATEAVERLLPPLAIDTDALRATILAMGVAGAVAGAVHAGLLAGLRGRWPRALPAAVLLCALEGAALAVLAAAAWTRAAVGGAPVGWLVAAGVAAFAASAISLIAATRLAGELRSRSARSRS